jgi:hypothetical protein
MKRQSSKDRLQRLSMGCCPIHGIPMYQVGLTKDETAFVVECPRKDCHVRVVEHEPFGPAVLLQTWAHLVF